MLRKISEQEALLVSGGFDSCFYPLPFEIFEPFSYSDYIFFFYGGGSYDGGYYDHAPAETYYSDPASPPAPPPPPGDAPLIMGGHGGYADAYYNLQ